MRPSARLLILMVAGASIAVTATPASAHRYRNAKYGIAVGLPRGVGVCGPVAPGPDHGVLFRPAGVTSPPCADDIDSGERYTAVDAHFAPVDEPVDVAALAEAECTAFAVDSQGRVTAVPPPTLPGRLPSAACRIDGADGSVIVALLARRAEAAGTPAVDYTLTLKTTRRLYATDYPAFVRWLAGARFFRPL